MSPKLAIYANLLYIPNLEIEKVEVEKDVFKKNSILPFFGSEPSAATHERSDHEVAPQVTNAKLTSKASNNKAALKNNECDHSCFVGGKPKNNQRA